MMSISSVGSSSLLFQLYVSQSTQSNQSQFQQIQTDFNQLGQDLQSGNLTQAQQDFATLQQALPSGQTQQTQQNSASPVTQAFTALLKRCNQEIFRARRTPLPLCSRTFSSCNNKVRVRARSITTITAAEIIRKVRLANGQQGNTIATDFSALSQALQSGNLAGAQSAFATLQQDLTQQFGGYTSNGATTGTSTAPTGGTLNVTA